MKTAYATMLAGLLFLGGSLSAGAAGLQPHQVAPSAGVVTFKVKVVGSVPRGTMFWVAYGPLVGQWGIIPLRAKGNGTYSTAKRLPTNVRTVFSFLQSPGAIRSGKRVEPKGPAITFARIGPV